MTEANTPSDQLATLAVDRLINSGLLRAERREALLTKVAAGSMTQADWRTEIDLAALKGKS